MFIEIRTHKSYGGIYTKTLINTNDIIAISNRPGYSEPMVTIEVKKYPDKTWRDSGTYTIASKEITAYHRYEDIMAKLTGVRYATELTGPFG